MAAVTPSSVERHSAGDLTLTIAKFAATTDNGDTWASGIGGIVDVSATQNDASGVQAATGAGAAYSGSTITIYLAEDNSAVTLRVLHAS